MNPKKQTHWDSANSVPTVPIRLPSWDEVNSVISPCNALDGEVASNMDAPPDKQPATHQI